MRGQSLTRRIAVGVAIATVFFILLSTALIGGLEWQKLQRRIDEAMSAQTRSVLSGLQMLHEAVTVSMHSQLKMLKSFFPYGTRVEIDAKETTEMGPTKMKVPIFRLGGIEMNERFIEDGFGGDDLRAHRRRFPAYLDLPAQRRWFACFPDQSRS
jgi:methyl-accepting chemotaxis protein-2 (aspartate sensor receptor)